jgi:hypothetical protein
MELSPNHRFPRLLKVLRFTALVCLGLRFLAGASILRQSTNTLHL